MRRHGLQAFALSAIALACNFVTGVIAARALGPSGRGGLTAIVTSPGLAAWVFGMGAMEANAYWRATKPSDGPSLLTTWLVLLLPLSIGAVCALELGIPTLLHAQASNVVMLARLWALTVAIAILMQILNGALLGARDYRWFNISRYAPFATVALIYFVLDLAGHFTLQTALLANLVASISNAVVIAIVIIKTHGGLGRFNWPAARPTLLYGIKAHGANLGLVVSTRLDLIIMPAFLSAASVGLYSVGTGLSWVVVTIAGALAPLVLPASVAASPNKGSHRVVLTGLLLTFAIAAPLAVALGILCGPLIELMYGRAFESSVMALRCLLPGCVALAGAYVLWSGLNGAGRPGAALLSQIPGVILTIGGLSLFLGRYGISAAALISSVAYIACFISAALCYMKISGLTVAEVRVLCREIVEAELATILREVRELPGRYKLRGG